MKTYSYLIIALLADYEPETGMNSSNEEMLIMEKSEDAFDGKGEEKYRSDLKEELTQKQEVRPLKPHPDMSKKRKRHH